MSVQRPLSVSIIGWFLVIMYSLSFISVFSMFSPQGQELLAVLGQSVLFAVTSVIVCGVIGLVSGIAILKGRNWGRILYAVFIPLLIILTCLINGFDIRLITTLLFYAVFMFFLTRAKANEFFKGFKDSAEKNQLMQPVGQKKRSVLGIVRKIIGGLFFTLGSFSVPIIIPALFFSEMFFGEENTAIILASFLIVLLFVLILLVIPGLLIWGRKAWRSLFAISYTVIGIISLLNVVQYFIMTYSRQWQMLISDFGEDLTYQYDYILFFSIFSLIFLPLGIFFIHLNNRKRKEQNSIECDGSL